MATLPGDPSKRRFIPKTADVDVKLQLDKDVLSALDSWIAAQRNPGQSRQTAIKTILAEVLGWTPPAS